AQIAVRLVVVANCAKAAKTPKPPMLSSPATPRCQRAAPRSMWRLMPRRFAIASRMSALAPKLIVRKTEGEKSCRANRAEGQFSPQMIVIRTSVTRAPDPVSRMRRHPASKGQLADLLSRRVEVLRLQPLFIARLQARPILVGHGKPGRIAVLSLDHHVLAED